MKRWFNHWIRCAGARKQVNHAGQSTPLFMDLYSVTLNPCIKLYLNVTWFTVSPVKMATCDLQNIKNPRNFKTKKKTTPKIQNQQVLDHLNYMCWKITGYVHTASKRGTNPTFSQLIFDIFTKVWMTHIRFSEQPQSEPSPHVSSDFYISKVGVRRSIQVIIIISALFSLSLGSPLDS